MRRSLSPVQTYMFHKRAQGVGLTRAQAGWLLRRAQGYTDPQHLAWVDPKTGKTQQEFFDRQKGERPVQPGSQQVAWERNSALQRLQDRAYELLTKAGVHVFWLWIPGEGSIPGGWVRQEPAQIQRDHDEQAHLDEINRFVDQLGAPKASAPQASPLA